MSMLSQVVISGCSGGGKSTLLGELRRRDRATIDEPGRRVILDQIQQGGNALPWTDMEAFLREVLRVATMDLEEAAWVAGPVFFDRGLIDAAAALQRLCGVSLARSLGKSRPYGRLVFLAPPWSEIYCVDEARRHTFLEAKAEYAHLDATYRALGYEVRLLPYTSVTDRADFVLETICRC
ncbi:AAA family ATPase [Marinobacter sp. ST-43]|jgi:predicted ATPase|uniref:AAA family ATPase n=1 Tax=Marinobacter sp. ST-43 TaxID=3050453 RepID=UPI0026DFC2E4|nr:AAA family ATPase [Marinobacter sp. ST-43]|tara:strand:+ start:304 stop:843 length:540 start_codon:yes stop_codon:yes gene_type:complete